MTARFVGITTYLRSQETAFELADVNAALRYTMSGGPFSVELLKFLLGNILETAGCVLKEGRVPIRLLELMCRDFEALYRGMRYVCAYPDDVAGPTTDIALKEMFKGTLKPGTESSYENQLFSKVNGGQYFVESMRNVSCKAVIAFGKICFGDDFAHRLECTKRVFHRWISMRDEEVYDNFNLDELDR